MKILNQECENFFSYSPLIAIFDLAVGIVLILSFFVSQPIEWLAGQKLDHTHKFLLGIVGGMCTLWAFARGRHQRLVSIDTTARFFFAIFILFATGINWKVRAIFVSTEIVGGLFQINFQTLGYSMFGFLKNKNFWSCH